jgi:hypothetical protein
VICYEQRADMIPPALTNIRAYALPGEPPDLTLDWPPKPHARPVAASNDDETDDPADETPPEPIVATGPSNLLVKERDITAGIDERDVDRLVLDLPEPWRVLPHALEALRPGGVIACYSPSIVQVQRTVEELEATRGFAQIEPLEVLYRPWHVKGQAVRPVQQMVSHTAFLTFARRLAVRGRTGSDDPLAPDDDDDVFIDTAIDDVPGPDADPD